MSAIDNYPQSVETATLAPDLEGVFLIPSSDGGTREMTISEVIRDLEGNPTEITFMATDGSGDTKPLKNITGFLDSIDQFRKPEEVEHEQVTEEVRREVGEEALVSAGIEDPSDPEGDRFAAMFDPDFGKGLTEQQMLDQARVKPTPEEEAATQLKNARAAADHAYNLARQSDASHEDAQKSADRASGR